MILVFYKLNSAIESGTKPDTLGRKPCHWTSTLKAAMVKARRAWKYSQPRCMTRLKWQTSVSIESTVSTSMRSCHAPRGHTLRLAGSRMVKIIMRPRVRSISGAPQVVHSTESCRHSRLPGWIAEKAGRCPSPDDCAPDDNGLHTR